jgi:uncharacterized protein YbjT (DUF2867 family)
MEIRPVARRNPPAAAARTPRMANVFVTGGTGYIGQRLIPEILGRGHAVRALVRNGSIAKLPAGAAAVVGNPLDRATFAGDVAPSDTFVQLVGVPHPSPRKAQQFREIDLVSVTESAAAARGAGVRHFIYLSVAQPAPVMRDYVDVRAEGERMIRESGMAATFVRPWYVLGPGHRWPYLILPLYWLWGLSPKSRDTARRLYPVTLRSVVRAIADAVDAVPQGTRIIEAPELRRA